MSGIMSWLRLRSGMSIESLIAKAACERRQYFTDIRRAEDEFKEAQQEARESLRGPMNQLTCGSSVDCRAAERDIAEGLRRLRSRSKTHARLMKEAGRRLDLLRTNSLKSARANIQVLAAAIEKERRGQNHAKVLEEAEEELTAQRCIIPIDCSKG